jgi:phenylalanyl-tRNA synthetase beta chain
MQQWSGGEIASELVDAYPLPPQDPVVEIVPADVRRWLGISLSVQENVGILERLAFECDVVGEKIVVRTPPHRLDISTGVVGKADLMEEVARIYGYDRIPETRMVDALPPQRTNRALELEERLRDLLVGLGLQEVITHRLTSPAREARTLPSDSDETPYFTLANPISPERSVMRHSLLASVLEIVEHNARIRERMLSLKSTPYSCR